MGRNPVRLGLLLLALCTAPHTGADDQPSALEPGRAVERRLAPGEVHHWTVPATAGTVWRLHARQLGIDLAIEVFDPAQQSLGTVDGPIGRRGVETILVEPAAAGAYQVEVRATMPRAAAGLYRLRLDQLTGADPARLAAERAMTAAARHAAGDRDSRLRAFESYRLALDGWRALGERGAEARCLHAMALLLKDLRDGGVAGDPAELFRQAANLWHELGEPGLEALALGGLAIAELERVTGEEAAAMLQRALALNHEAGQIFEAANNRMNLGYVAQRQGAPREARASYEQALELFRQTGDATLEAVLLGNLGGVSAQLGDAAPALDRYRQSLAMHRAAGDRKQEARILNNLAALHRSLGEAERALELYDQAGRIYVELGDRRGEARVLNNTGYAYRGLGELERANGYFQRALALRQELGDRRGAASTLSNLGSLHDRRGELIEALGYYRRSLELKRALGDHRGEASMTGLIGLTLARLGRGEDAREHFARARKLLAGHGNPPTEARIRTRQAEALLELGDLEPAAAAAAQAVTLYRTIDSPAGLAAGLVVLARAERARDRLAAARAALEEALATVEELRAGLGNPAFRQTFLGSRSSLWEIHVDLLMEMHRRDPGADFERAALQAAEHARARGLLDLLAEAGAELRRGFDPELVERRSELVRRLSLLAGGAGKVERATAIEETQADLDLVEAEMRRRHPGFAALNRHHQLDAAAMQELLGAGDLLLYYSLGEERSFLWAVAAATIEVFELAPRPQIENTARRAHRELATRLLGRRIDEPAATDLGRMVLGPIASRLGGSARLLIVADGALHWVPFAALPVPPAAAGATGGRLLEHLEVTHLPSIAVLAALAGPRRAHSSERSVAVVADPVFDVCDPRARSTAGSCRGESAVRDATARFARLPGSRREAEAIAAVAPGDVPLALAFAADRELATGGRLDAYRFVHFATHGVVDTENPRLSGLVFSGSDVRGRPRDGVLRLDEIYNLELSADLVVLSGCHTAAGREIRGEGLVGLVRGFLYAGARQVVASLWQVDDSATVELMRHFYLGLLDRGLTPAAALRSAQLTMAGQPRTRDPYYWAGFVVQGSSRPETGTRRATGPAEDPGKKISSK